MANCFFATKVSFRNEMKQAAVNLVFLTGVEKLLVLRSKSINKIVDTIKTKLLPLAIGMLIAFGITKLTQKDQKVCPSKDQLKDVIRKRNRTIKQLNQIYQTIVLNTGLAAAFALGIARDEQLSSVLEGKGAQLLQQAKTLDSQQQTTRKLLTSRFITERRS